MLAVSCESCGMPLAGAEDHALHDPSIPYCAHCAPDGKLQSAEERLERFTQWTMRQEGLDYAAARDKARSYLKTMPAWKDAAI
jgi:hypothetical protein